MPYAMQNSSEGIRAIVAEAAIVLFALQHV
jgi:hypothetical protein